MLSEQLDHQSRVQMFRNWGLLLVVSILSLVGVFYDDLQLYLLGGSYR
jgi:hypothetical protein